MPYSSKEKRRAAYARKMATDPESIRVKDRAKYLRNREKYLAYQRQLYLKHGDRERERSRRRRKENPEAVALTQRKRALKQYGLTLEKYDAMLAHQGGICGMPGCGATVPGGIGAWKIDHDHKTGTVRGLLCNLCNTMIGYARERVEILAGAIEYLQKDWTIPMTDYAAVVSAVMAVPRQTEPMPAQLADGVRPVFANGEVAKAGDPRAKWRPADNVSR